MRTEKDFLGQIDCPEDFPFGIHTLRAMNNFSFSDEKINLQLFAALILVKKAAALANRQAGLLEDHLTEKIVEACDEISENIKKYIPPLHPLQGGAGTSTNMAANELIANIALKKMGKAFGNYSIISPLNHVNLSQSTNDTYPTAVKIALLKGLKRLHISIEGLLAELLKKEKEFESLLKIGRTQLQDAMPLSLGQEFSAWAGAVSRFRWRMNKAIDWIREINLTGTAVGTSINADRNYALHVINILRELVKEPLTLARNLVDATQNTDQIVEVSGLIKTGAVSIKKIALDLRLLSSGPKCGFGEINLPQVQAGSTIMPGKVNPVILEAAEQVCLKVIGGDLMVSVASSESNLEIPQFLPLIAHVMLENIDIFSNMIIKLAETVKGIKANVKRIEKNVNTSIAIATLLSPEIGYNNASELVKEAESGDRDIIDLIKEKKMITEQKLKKLLSPQVMASPGLPILENDKDA